MAGGCICGSNYGDAPLLWYNQNHRNVTTGTRSSGNRTVDETRSNYKNGGRCKMTELPEQQVLVTEVTKQHNDLTTGVASSGNNCRPVTGIMKSYMQSGNNGRDEV